MLPEMRPVPISRHRELDALSLGRRAQVDREGYVNLARASPTWSGRICTSRRFRRWVPRGWSPFPGSPAGLVEAETALSHPPSAPRTPLRGEDAMLERLGDVPGRVIPWGFCGAELSPRSRPQVRWPDRCPRRGGRGPGLEGPIHERGAEGLPATASPSKRFVFERFRIAETRPRFH